MAEGKLAGDAPVGVVIENKLTGVVTPCHVAYMGIDPETGLHSWMVNAEDYVFDTDIDAIKVAVLPPKTSLEFSFNGKEPGIGEETSYDHSPDGHQV